MSRPPRNPAIAMRNGVSPSSVALPAGGWPGVLDFLAERLSAVSREDWAQRMAQGLVLDEHARPVPPDARYAPQQLGGRLHYYRHLALESVPVAQATVLYQDAHLLVAEKPHFIPVTPGGRYVQGSLLVQLKAALNLPELSPIHRIDRETAGLVLFSVRQADRGAYQALFRDRAVHKVYDAVAPLPPPDGSLPPVRCSRIVEDPAYFFRMTEVPGEPNSETRLTLLGGIHGRAGLGVYRLQPVTGRRHQLRVHMAALGLPLLGDQFYPTVKQRPGEPDDTSQPLQLLARQIAFKDPLSGAARAFESRMQLGQAQSTGGC
jgi:tRNA pseudouridine32 synthase/23S rRNA pseudouridine746 synthase